VTGEVLAANAGLIAVLMVTVWLVSLAVRDASIVDIVWGLGFTAVAWMTFAVGDGSASRRLLLALMVSVWGLRLAAYLAWRNLGHGEDYRYAAMRKRYGARFWLVSLGLVFGLQGVLMWVVSLPVQVAGADGSPSGLGALDLAGLTVFVLGLVFEAGGDWQLSRFKSDPRNEGRVLDSGLWAWTRHPNYFGDFLVWWGIYLVALATESAWWTIVGPVVMSVLLLRVSGVALLERGLRRRWPDYEAYVRRTSAFFPRPPRDGRSAPRAGN